MGSLFQTRFLQAISPFKLEWSSLVCLSAFLGRREMLLYWKRNLEFVDEDALPSRDLYRAVKRNDERATRLLLENCKVDINHKQFHRHLGLGELDPENAPLRNAARKDCHRIIKALLRHPELDVNFQGDYDNTALMLATGGLTVAALCKSSKLNIYLHNSLGETAFDIFVKSGNASEIEELAKHPHFKVNRRNRWNETLLITAVRLRQVQVVETLLRVPNIDLEACDADGLSALGIAERLDHCPLRRLLSTPTDSVIDSSRDFIEDLSVALVPQ